MIETVCPQCATLNTSEDDLAPHADNFCVECDFPLFWDQLLVPSLHGADPTDASLRRLPGVAGRDGRAMRVCPECAEPNLVDSLECIRCLALMDPPPPPPPAPEPEVWIEPAPPVDPGPDYVFIALIIIALIMVVGLAAYGYSFID